MPAAHFNDFASRRSHNSSNHSTPVSSGAQSPVPEFLKNVDLLKDTFRTSSECRNCIDLCSNFGSDGDEHSSILVSILGWYPCLLLRMFRTLFYITCSQTIMAVPMLWLLFIWKLIMLPVSVMELCLRPLFGSYNLPEEDSWDEVVNRTVLISNGSTIQALHLARNFYKTGARVVVFEFDGYFPLTKFSNSIARFYTLPKSCRDNSHEYGLRLRDIVLKENISYYVPVCALNSVLMDAQAKKYLEPLRCACFCPDEQNVALVNDPYTMLKFCEKLSKPVPEHRLISNKDDLIDFYMESNGHLPTNSIGRYLMCTAKKPKIQLPLKLVDVNEDELNINGPSLIINEPTKGYNFYTCTTIKNTKVIANVTCRIDNRNLVVVNDPEIESWLKMYFDNMSKHNSHLSGHLSFEFCKNAPRFDNILPISCKFTISLPYICYNSDHVEIICKCARKNKPTISSLSEKGHLSLLIDVQKNFEKVNGKILDRDKTLFAVRDPLPYCAYFYLRIFRFIKQKKNAIPRTFHSLIVR